MNKYNTSNTAFLVTGGTLSYLGDLLYLMALNVWISRATGSPELLGMIMSIGSFALFLGNPIGGILADRFDKRTLLFVTDIISALAVLLTYYFYDHGHVNVVPILICNVIISFSFAIYSPTSRALAPLVTSGDGIRKLNSLLSVTGEITKIASPAIGGLLLANSLLGERSLILINSFSFFISGIMNLFLKLTSNEDLKIEHTLTYEIKNLVTSYKEIWLKMDEIRLILVPISLVNLFSGGLHVLLPFLDPTVSKILYPKYLLAEALGAVIGGTISARLKSDLNWIQSHYLLIFSGIALIGLHRLLPIELHYVLLFLFGISIAIFNVNFFTVVQKHADEKYIGRIFGLIFTFISALVPVGNLLYSKIESWIPGYGITSAGIGMSLSVMVLLIINNKKLRLY